MPKQPTHRVKVDRSGLLKRIGAAISNLLESEGNLRMTSLIGDMRIATPIRTGYARSRWSFSDRSEFAAGYRVVNNSIFFGKREWVLTNDAPYIGRLNMGSSQQAPAYFIESVLLQHGFKIDKLPPVGVERLKGPPPGWKP